MEWHLSKRYVGDERVTVGDLDQQLEPAQKAEIVAAMNNIGWVPFMTKVRSIHFGQLRAVLNAFKESALPVAHLSEETRNKYTSQDDIKKDFETGDWNPEQLVQGAQIIDLVFRVRDDRPIFEPLVMI